MTLMSAVEKYINIEKPTVNTNTNITWRRGPNQIKNKKSNKNHFRLRDWNAVQSGLNPPYRDVSVIFKEKRDVRDRKHLSATITNRDHNSKIIDQDSLVLCKFSEEEDPQSILRNNSTEITDKLQNRLEQHFRRAESELKDQIEA